MLRRFGHYFARLSTGRLQILRVNRNQLLRPQADYAVCKCIVTVLTPRCYGHLQNKAQ